MAKNTASVTPITLLADEPIQELEQDGLGLKSWATVVAGIALGTEGPFTVGIFGRWGSGKTSILRLAKSMVERSSEYEQGRITTVGFNAWEYEQESFPLLPLVASILSELGKSKNRRPMLKVKQEAQKLQDAFRSLLFGLSTKLTAKVPLVGEASLSLDSKNAIERYEALRSKWIEQQIDTSLCYKASQTLKEIQEYDEKEKRHRLVVFIDDLDRCFPDKAIQLLESMKTVLNHPGFIFVLAIDRNVLECYLNKRYTEEFGLKYYNHGQSYLDKIIQLPLWIPPHERRFDLMIENVLARREMEKHRAAFEPLTEIFGWACEHNPRQLIRLLNDILVGQMVYQLSRFQGDFPLSAFVVAHGIRHQSDAVYQGLVRNQPLCNKLKAAKDVASFQGMLLKLLEANKADEGLASVLRGVQARESMVRLLISSSGRDWLENSEARGRVDNFLAVGWNDARGELDEVIWMKTQVQTALSNLESTNDDVITAACDTLLILGDHTCLPLLKRAQAKWKGETRVRKALNKTYQELRRSYGTAGPS